MTVRSASRQRPERPKVSFVFAVHDPEYGGGLLARTQTHLDALIALANRYRLPAEIIIVEWNPRQDRVPFRDSLRWPDDLGPVGLRFLEVPADIHRTLPNADRLPIFEYIAKNAGLRRARGQFLLATNPDLFFSPALVRWLARTSLSTERFYRVDRRDLSEDMPNDTSLSRRLRFCSRHVAHVHAFFGSYRPGTADRGRRLKDEYDRWAARDDRGGAPEQHAGRAADSSRRRSPPQCGWRLLPDGAAMVAPVARLPGAVHPRAHRRDSLLGGSERWPGSGNPPFALPPVSPGTPSGESRGFSADRLEALV